MSSLPDIQEEEEEDLGDQIHQFWLAFSVSYVQQNVDVVKRLEVVEVVTRYYYILDIQGYLKLTQALWGNSALLITVSNQIVDDWQNVWFVMKSYTSITSNHMYFCVSVTPFMS